MKLKPTIIVLALLSASSASAQVIRYSSPAAQPDAPVTDSTMTARLRQAAVGYRAHAPIARFAQYDIGYPRDSMEYRALNGYAVLLIVAVAQDTSDLPLARVYFRPEEGTDQELPLLGATCREVSGVEQEIIAVLGRYRCDALYLLPLLLRARRGDVLIDFAAHEFGLPLSRFDGTSPPVLAPLPLSDPGPKPDLEALRVFLQREYPDLSVSRR